MVFVRFRWFSFVFVGVCRFIGFSVSPLGVVRSVAAHFCDLSATDRTIPEGGDPQTDKPNNPNGKRTETNGNQRKPTTTNENERKRTKTNENQRKRTKTNQNLALQGGLGGGLAIVLTAF